LAARHLAAAASRASKWRTNFVSTIKEVTAIAKAEAAEWRKGVDAKQARQLIPFEIQSEDGGKDYKTITNRIITKLGKDGDQDPTDTLLKHIMRPGFAFGLQGLLRDAGLPITVRSARSGRGGYLATHSPNILLEVSGPRWAVKVLNEELANALEQTGGNVIRNPSMSEKMAGAKLTGVIEIPLPDGVTDDQITAMMNDIMLIQDSAGASGANFLGGYTTILDDDGQPSIAIHGGFYEGGNFVVEAGEVIERIEAAAVLHLGTGDSKITERIVDAYKNKPASKYDRRRANRADQGNKPESGDQGGASVPSDSIRSKAQSGLRAYFLERSKGARASSVRA
jgi:hypothetical protein